MTDWIIGLWEASGEIAAEYGVDPLIFFAIHFGTVPVFWWFLYLVARNFKRGWPVWPPALGAMLMSASAYIYVFLAGRGLPGWVYALAGVLVAVAIFITIRKIRRQKIQVKERMISEKVPDENSG